MLESEYVTELLLTAPKILPTIRLFKRSVGVFNVDGRTFRAGMKGQADLYGLIKGGRHLEIEVKNVRGILRDEQKKWRVFCELWGIPWLELRVPAGLSSDRKRVALQWCEEIRKAGNL